MEIVLEVYIVTVCLIVASILLYQLLFWVFIKDFKVKNICYILSPILTGVILGLYYYFSRSFNVSLLPYSLILVVLINLSFIDCKYYEISGNSYWFLLLPSIAIMAISYKTMYLNLFSFLLLFILFWIIDKLIGVEKIGGADVKILLILALTITFFDTFTLLAVSFLIDTLIYMIKLTIENIKGNNDKIKIPMIVAITIAWVIICLFNVA